MLNRDKRSMIFGVGVGICVSVAILFVVYIVQRHNHFNHINELNERIYELQNLFLEDSAEREQEHDAPNLLIPTTTAQNIEQTQTNNEETTTPQHEETTTTPTAQTTAYTMPITQAASPPAEGDRVWVHIPTDIGAFEIAQILSGMGVVEDFTGFVDFLVDNDFTLSLMAGNFLLPLDGDFEVIMSFILAGDR